jgi:hypothetical protein
MMPWAAALEHTSVVSTSAVASRSPVLEDRDEHVMTVACAARKAQARDFPAHRRSRRSRAVCAAGGSRVDGEPRSKGDMPLTFARKGTGRLWRLPGATRRLARTVTRWSCSRRALSAGVLPWSPSRWNRTSTCCDRSLDSSAEHGRPSSRRALLSSPLHQFLQCDQSPLQRLDDRLRAVLDVELRVDLRDV